MLRFMLLPLLLLVASCATDKPAAAAPAASRATMSEKFLGPPIKQNANGEWPANMQQVSTFDGQRQSPYFNGKSTIAKPYQTGEYTKTSWWGKKEVATQPYTGNTDANRLRSTSRLQGLGAREAGTAASIPAPFPTGTYQTSAAREGDAKRFDKPTDAATEARRRVFPEPEISTWKQQRALDVNTTRSILGRDK
ncbi:MAG: hypothetical protein NTW21_22425 [Verrucomicrobia bacterium]|nr:hypothetical protein [Verrucomicrobiota bacterium]